MSCVELSALQTPSFIWKFCLLCSSTEGLLLISPLHPWTAVSCWLSSFCLDVKCACVYLQTGERYPLFELPPQYTMVQTLFICKHCSVCTGHLFNSAHLNYALAPITHPDCLCDEPLKSHQEHQIKDLVDRKSFHLILIMLFKIFVTQQLMS